jgi:hypothetical protein
VTDIPEGAEGTRAICGKLQAAALQLVSRTPKRPGRPDHRCANALFARSGE